MFQNFNLLPRLTAAGNVELPSFMPVYRDASVMTEPWELLGRVGLMDRAGHRPAELSGAAGRGVAVARALVNDPSLILADEPTGTWTAAAAHRSLDLLLTLHREGRTILIVTHDEIQWRLVQTSGSICATAGSEGRI